MVFFVCNKTIPPWPGSIGTSILDIESGAGVGLSAGIVPCASVADNAGAGADSMAGILNRFESSGGIGVCVGAGTCVGC